MAQFIGYVKFGKKVKNRKVWRYADLPKKWREEHDWVKSPDQSFVIFDRWCYCIDDFINAWCAAYKIDRYGRKWFLDGNGSNTVVRFRENGNVDIAYGYNKD